MSARFVHLHLHTEYSIVDGLARVKPLVKALQKRGMPACAVTDHSNLFALIKFYQAAQGAGIKPIAGAELWVQQGDELSRLVLLCQNLTGYRSLMRLVSLGYTDGQSQGVPQVKREWVARHADGLIVLSGGHAGDVGQALLAGNQELARERLEFWRAAFPNRFYLELQRTGRPLEEDYLHAAVELAQEFQTPVVATNDVRFLDAEDFEAHEVRVCIHEGYTLDDNRRPRRYSPQQYLRDPGEMAELFSDIPEALENTWLIAQRCNLELSLGQNFLPQFEVPDGKTTAEWFREQSRLGLERRLEFLYGERAAAKRQPYDERLELELDVIVKMDFPGYFLIVADFIQWAKNNGIPVGPGRGSGAGSLVAYALGITDLDPLQYDLLFERFLNPERVSMPDFDVDFCMEGRDRVIEYVAQKYGRDRVSQIITYGSMAAKAVVRDVGRVLGHPYGFVDQISKLIPFEVGITLEQAMEQEEVLRKRYQDDEEVRALIDMAQKLEGLTRNAGKHAGGVVIAPTALTDFAPLYCEEGETNVVTQYDKNDVETVGLVKFDFLGLRTLTIIDWALQTINRGRAEAEKLDILSIKLDDPDTFKLLKSGNTTAVFQLESRGMQELIKRLKPDCFEDIVALVALFRPGPLQSGMVDDFINRKHGRAKVEYPHPKLEPILKPTYGVILYQEQVMQIAQVLAGYTLGGADMLRRAMGKKKPEEMAKQRSIFTEGSVANGVKAETATYIFDLMEKFAGYGFNKSHSAAYALISYQTAWLKVHYSAPFMAAVLSSDMDNTDKVVLFINECEKQGLQARQNPHVNHSEYRFTAAADRTVVYGLGAIKGAGEAALQMIVEEREAHGPYQDLFDFCRRVDLRKCNRRVLEALIKAGAMDGLGPNRATLSASLDTALKLAEQHSSNHNTGQNDMFGLLAAPSAQTEPALPFVTTAPWPLQQELGYEKDVLGLYLSGHPIEPHLAELRHFTRPIAEARPAKREIVKLAGLIVQQRMIKSRRGRMAALTLDDRSARIEAMLYSETYDTYQALLKPDQIVVVEGEVSEDDYNGGYSLSVNRLWSLEQARETHLKRLSLSLDAQLGADVVPRLQKLLDPYRQGSCPVSIEYRRRDASAVLSLGPGWQISPRDDLIVELRQWLGQERVRMVW